MSDGQDGRLRVAAAAGFLFALSAVKLPSVAGSCLHAVGVALGAILLGPAVMTAQSFVFLAFQALVLAHGGITTLGANLFSLGVVGPWAAWWVAGGHAPARGRASPAGFRGSIAVYITTAAVLAVAFPDAAYGMSGSFIRFSGSFAKSGCRRFGGGD
jgi:cobalt/nickel transport system permease protein